MSDFWRVEIQRSRTDGQGATRTFRTKREVLRDDEVLNGIEYRYVIYSVDVAGNRPNGVERRATPHRILLLRPRDGAVISRPPLFDWVKKARARFYWLPARAVQERRLAEGAEQVADCKLVPAHEDVALRRPALQVRQRLVRMACLAGTRYSEKTRLRESDGLERLQGPAEIARALTVRGAAPRRRAGRTRTSRSPSGRTSPRGSAPRLPGLLGAARGAARARGDRSAARRSALPA